MIAKQTVVSASLVVWLAGATGTAIADPDAPPEPAASEVSVETEDDPACDADADAPGCVAPDPPLPAPTGTFQIGAGFSTDDSFVATARIAQDNLFGTGSSLALNARLSGREQLFLIRFVDPKLLGSDLTLAADLYSTRRDFTGFTRQAAGGSLLLSHPLGDHLVGFVGYRLEHVEVETDISALALARGAGAIDDLQLGGGLLSSLRAGIAYDDRDNPMRPRHGTAAGAMIEVADRRLGSDIELARASGWLNHHRSLGPFTLHLGGTITGVTSRDPRGVPLSERLQLDGSSDIRGYAPGSLGPFDRRTGIALGGNLEATARAELELPVFPSIGISAAGFLDAGGIYDLDGRGGTGASAGFGLLWDSPIGPLRFDWAFPLDGGKPRFLFSFGGSF